MNPAHFQRIYKKNSLVSYTPMAFLYRFILVSFLAVITLRLLLFLVRDVGLYPTIRPVYYLVFVLFYNVMTESQIFIDNILEFFLPVPQKLKLRLSLQFFIGFAVLIITNRIIIFFIESRLGEDINIPYLYIGVLIGLFSVSIVINVITIGRLAEKWYYSMRQIDILKQEKLQMDYNSLQDKLNPHFLFNNLSVLRGLIHTDTENASVFIENLADVYRYVLKSSDKQLVSLSEELEFLQAYLGLHKIRIKDGLIVTVQIDDEEKIKQVAPLTMQLLIENAIKHNVTVPDNPLKINIQTLNGFIVVTNPIQKKESTYSTNMGLKNLIRRYEILSKKRIIIKDSGNEFVVKIPLI